MACIEASARKNGPAALFGPGRHDRSFRGRFALTPELIERRRAPPPRLDGQLQPLHGFGSGDHFLDVAQTHRDVPRAPRDVDRRGESDGQGP